MQSDEVEGRCGRSMFFFVLERRPPKSTPIRSSAASDVYKRQSGLRAGLSAVGETGIPGVTVECVDIGKNTNGEGRSLGRY